MYNSKVKTLMIVFIFMMKQSFLALGDTTASPTTTTTTEGPDESKSVRKLRQDLLIGQQYDRMARPVKNHLTTTKVDLKMTINEFVDLDIANSYLVTDAWFHIYWKDEFLTWNPDDYTGVKQIHLGANEIWKPDLVLINSAHQVNILSIFTDSEIMVNSTGHVFWITMAMLYSKCPIWAYDYPFEKRPITCTLSFCSLIYESHEVNITTPASEFFIGGPYMANPRLLPYNITTDRSERGYDNYGTYSFLQLIVKIRRIGNPVPYIVRTPTMISIFMILCMFFLPITWPVRIHLVLFATFMQLLLILYIGQSLGPNAIGLSRSTANLRIDLFLGCLALVSTLVFRRCLAMADIMPPLPFLVTGILSGPIGQFLCFGISQSEYIPAAESIKNTAKSQQQTSRPSNFGPAMRNGNCTSILPKSLTGSSRGDHETLINEECDIESQAAVIKNHQQQQQVLRNNTGNHAFDEWQPSATVTSLFPQMVVVSNSQFEWLQVVVFCDRVMFIVYAFIMVPRLF